MSWSYTITLCLFAFSLWTHLTLPGLISSQTALHIILAGWDVAALRFGLPLCCTAPLCCSRPRCTSEKRDAELLPARREKKAPRKTQRRLEILWQHNISQEENDAEIISAGWLYSSFLMLKYSVGRSMYAHMSFNRCHHILCSKSTEMVAALLSGEPGSRP